MVITDLSRMYRHVGGSRRRRIFECYLLPGFQAVKVYRFGHWLLQQRKATRRLFWPVYSYLRYKIKKKWGIDIVPDATIGSGFVIFHFGCVFVGPATIGKNVTITHDVTIGLAGLGSRRGAPTIGDNVLISPGAKLAGRIRVGNNARIGANAVIQRDVPDNALVQVGAMQVVTFPSFYSSSAGTTHENITD